MGSLVTRSSSPMNSCQVSDELGVLGRVDRHEVVPGGQVADQRRGVETSQFLFADREGDDRDVPSAEMPWLPSSR